ncbi:MAG: hypothetical protein ACYSSI_10145 [Planctomycetota bacterium]|jgi:hypothetical protein
MAKTQFILEADKGKAVAAFLDLIDKQEKTTAGLRKMNKEGRKAGDATARGAKNAGKELKGVSGEMGKVGQAAKSSMTNITSWIAGFASVTSIAMGIKKIVDGMKEAAGLRKEMLGVAVSTEQLSLKIANLRRDVSEKGVETVTKDIADISRKTKVPLDVASQMLFYSESALGAGTKTAKSAAMTIGEFAGPAGLTSEEVKQIPKLFSITKADTRKKQLELLNQMYAATRESIAEAGEWVEPFVSTVVSDIERGFTPAESMARFTSAIETTGSIAEAANMSKRLIDVVSGRNKQALEFLSKQFATEEAGRMGVDVSKFMRKKKSGELELEVGKLEEHLVSKGGKTFGQMTDPERFVYGEKLYLKAKAEGRTDWLKTQLDTKGFAAMRALYSETARRKYAEVLPKIEAAKESDVVQQMSKQYQGLMTAKSIGRQTRKTMAQSRLGKEREPDVVLSEITDDVFKLYKAGLEGLGEYVKVSAYPAKKRHISRMIVRQNLGLALEKAEGGQKYAEIESLMKEFEQTTFLSTHPELVGRLSKATKGFSLLEEEGRVADPETFKKVRMKHRQIIIDPHMIGSARESTYETTPKVERSHDFTRGLFQYYGIENPERANIKTDEAIQKLENAAKKMDDAATKLLQHSENQPFIPAGGLD